MLFEQKKDSPFLQAYHQQITMAAQAQTTVFEPLIHL